MTKLSYSNQLSDKLNSIPINNNKSTMTVKQFLEFQTQAMIEVIEERSHAVNADLDQEWRLAEIDLQKMRQVVLEKAQLQSRREDDEEDELCVASSASTTAVQNMTSSSSSSSTIHNRSSSSRVRSANTVRVTVLSGPHSGEDFILKPRARSYSWIGRSTGQKFTKNGISLCEDQEVSTAHGKILVKTGKFYYSDHGSTNGSFLVTENDEIELQPDFMQELEDGMVIRIGLGNLKISL